MPYKFIKTGMSEQTVHVHITLLLNEQFDQGLHFLVWKPIFRTYSNIAEPVQIWQNIASYLDLYCLFTGMFMKNTIEFLEKPPKLINLKMDSFK